MVKFELNLFLEDYINCVNHRLGHKGLPQSFFQLYPQGAMTLDRLLKHFIMSETVQDVQCEGCARRMGLGSQQRREHSPRTTFTKKLTIGRVSLSVLS